MSALLTKNVTTRTMSPKNKIGLGLAIVLGLSNIGSIGMPTPSGKTGPPIGVLIFDAVLGVVAVVAAVIAWRGQSRSAVRVAAGVTILTAITTLPAFFVSIPAWMLTLAAATVILAVVAVVLMLGVSRDPSPVVD